MTALDRLKTWSLEKHEEEYLEICSRCLFLTTQFCRQYNRRPKIILVSSLVYDILETESRTMSCDVDFYIPYRDGQEMLRFLEMRVVQSVAHGKYINLV